MNFNELELNSILKYRRKCEKKYIAEVDKTRE